MDSGQFLFFCCGALGFLFPRVEESYHMGLRVESYLPHGFRPVPLFRVGPWASALIPYRSRHLGVAGERYLMASTAPGLRVDSDAGTRRLQHGFRPVPFFFGVGPCASALIPDRSRHLEHET